MLRRTAFGTSVETRPNATQHEDMKSVQRLLTENHVRDYVRVDLDAPWTAHCLVFYDQPNRDRRRYP